VCDLETSRIGAPYIYIYIYIYDISSLRVNDRRVQTVGGMTLTRELTHTGQHLTSDTTELAGQIFAVGSRQQAARVKVG